MRRIRSWCALIFAITLVGTNAVYQLGTSFSAHEQEQKIQLEESSVEAAAEAAAEADTRTLSAKELVEAMEEGNTEDTAQVIITEIVE